MISYLVDAVLLLALIATSVKVVAMYRELRRLSAYHADYQRIFDQTTLALDGIEVSIQEINVHGSQVLNALGSRMDDARELISDIDALMRDAKKHQTTLRTEIKALMAEKNLQAERAIKAEKSLKAASRRLRPDVSDLDEPTAPRERPAAGLRKGQGNRLALPGAMAGTADMMSSSPLTSEMRVHRIDNSNANSIPFRSVSMNNKDNLK